MILLDHRRVDVIVGDHVVVVPDLGQHLGVLPVDPRDVDMQDDGRRSAALSAGHRKTGGSD